MNGLPPLWMVTQVNDSLDPVSAASRVMAFAQDMLRCSKEVSYTDKEYNNNCRITFLHYKFMFVHILRS